MRKVKPESVKRDFQNQLNDLSQFHAAGFAAFSSDKDKSTFTERSLLAAAVAWEGFASDMFVAYINRDPASFKEHLKRSFDDQLEKGATKPKLVFEKFGKLNFPLHLDKAEVQALADSRGNNITFSDFAELEDQASSWLVAAHAQKFSGLTAQQKAVIDALIALRNHIAHRSERSSKAMNEKLNRGALFPTGLKRAENNVSLVGAWLKAKPVNVQRNRITIIMDTLETIAATF